MVAKLTTEEFIDKAKNVHGKFYDYSMVEYKNTRTKVTITCPVHGEFDQKVNNHLRGQGCPECNKFTNHKSTKEEFIEKANNVHGNKYEYSKVEYKSSKKKVVITCPIHGDFEQKPNSHLNGQGCPECKRDKLKTHNLYDIDMFIEKARSVHGEKYSYSNITYSGNITKINAVCPVHGDFIQNTSYHLSGAGCPECGKERIGFWNPEYIKKYRNKLKDSLCTFYILECYSEHERFIKVGITLKTLEERYKNRSNFKYNFTTIHEYNSTLIHCSEIEQEVLRSFKEYKYEPMNKFGGSSECLTFEVLDSMLEILKQKELIHAQ